VLSAYTRAKAGIATAAILFATSPLNATSQDGLMQPAVSQPTVTASISDVTGNPVALASVARVASDGKVLHVTVGHSIFVDTRSRLHKVYVADPTVLNSVTLTPTEIIVTAMTPGISSLTLLDEGGQAQSYVISSDIDIDGLRSAMVREMRGDSVKVEGSGARVTLSGIVPTDAVADAAVKLASLYSKEVGNALTVIPSHPKQVRLEVRILVVDRSKLLQMGINLFNPGGHTSFLAATTTSQYPSSSTLSPGTGNAIGALATSNPLNFMLYSAKLNLGATIQDLQNKQVLQILAEPNITTISGQKADFLSGGEFPFPMVQPGSGAGSSPVVSISFRPFGVKVEFTPIVNEDGTIRLKVSPEVSALDYSNAVSISGFTVPALSTRRADTEVELRSNQSFAISGLLDQRTTDILAKTPGIASIPILGNLFKSKNINHSTTELIVVVTPTIVDPLTDNAVPAQPDLPVPLLDTKAFDDSLGRSHSTQPAAPVIDPSRPPNGNQVPPIKATPAATVQQPEPLPGAKATAQVSTASVPVTLAAMNAVATTPGKNEPQVSRTAAAAKGTKVIEVMTLSHASDAEAMIAALNRRGYNVAVNHDPQDSLLHLDIGPFPTSEDAETIRQKLLSDGYDARIK
jgi:pilus assembly protein CpaC